MTKKRFIVDDAGTLIDMHTGGMFDIVEEVYPLLNEQHETNEQLRHDATILIQSNQDYRKENEQLKQTIHRLEENIDELMCVNVEEELLKENEQLKQVIAENEKLIQSTYDELTKLRCIKKNLERIKSQWDWIMEAIQYD